MRGVRIYHQQTQTEMTKFNPDRSLREQLLDLGAEALDDTVHEEAANMAAAINNDGLKDQIEFLITQRGYTEEAVFKAAYGIGGEDD